MHTSRKNLFLYLPILILFLASFIWVLKAPDHFSWSADLYLRNDDTSVLSQLFYSDNDELSQDNSTDGTRDGNIVTFSGLPDLRSLTLFRFDPTNTQESYRVTHVGFFLNGEAFFTMDAADLEAQASPVNASWQLNGEELVFTPQNPDSSFLLSADSIREAAENAAAKLHVLYVRQRFFLALSIALLLCVLLFFRNGIASYLKTLFLPDSSGHFDWFALISTAVIAGALLVVCIIGLFSALGLHPDEWDVKACLDYGMTHFLPPDMRDPAVAQTYSGYGYTKLENYTWYFYLAGKIALLFKMMFCSLAYYRVPNLLLFAALAFYFVRNIRQKNWLMVALGICVQSWYIFSYTTADALDFTISFAITCLLCNPQSLLYRTVEKKKLCRRDIPAFLLLGLLFGNIALGKQCYLAILALSFFVLLLRLIWQKDPLQKKVLWRNYLIIVGVFLAVFAFRAGFDIAHYGTEKSQVKEAVAIQYADYDKNPSTPTEELNPSWHMYSRGYTLPDVFAENPDWFAMSYKSFCGLLQDHDTGAWYYWCMGLLYLTLFAGIGIATFRQPDNLQGNVRFVICTLLMVGELAASIVNSWLIESMAQGRYLLPCILIAGYLASTVPELFQKKIYRMLLSIAGILSVGYFGLVGIPLFF